MTSNSSKEVPLMTRRYSLLANHGNNPSLDRSLNSFNISRSPSLVQSISSTPKKELYNRHKNQNDQKTHIPYGYDEDPVETHDQVVEKLSLLHRFPSSEELEKLVQMSQPIKEPEEDDYNNMNPEQLREELRRINQEKVWIEAKNSTLEKYYLKAISTNAHSQMTLDQVRGRSRYRKIGNDANSSTSSSQQLKGSISNHNFMVPSFHRSRSGSIGLTDNSSLEDAKFSTLNRPIPRIIYKRQLSDRVQTLSSTRPKSKWASNLELFPRKTSDQLDASLISCDQFRFKSEDPEMRLGEVEKRIDYYVTKYMKRMNRIIPEQLRKDYIGLCRLQETFSLLKDELEADLYITERKRHIIYRVGISMDDALKMFTDLMRRNSIRPSENMTSNNNNNNMGSVLSLACSIATAPNGNKFPSGLPVTVGAPENMSTISSLSTNASTSQDYPDLHQFKDNLQILEQYFENYIERYKKMTSLPDSAERDRRIDQVKDQLVTISRLINPTNKVTTIVPEENLRMYFLTWERKNLIKSNDQSIDQGHLERIIQDHLSKLNLSDRPQAAFITPTSTVATLTHNNPVNNKTNNQAILLKSRESFTDSTIGKSAGDSGLGENVRQSISTQRNTSGDVLSSNSSPSHTSNSNKDDDHILINHPGNTRHIDHVSSIITSDDSKSPNRLSNDETTFKVPERIDLKVEHIQQHSSPIKKQLTRGISLRSESKQDSLDINKSSSVCLNDRFCKLWLLRTLKKYNSTAQSEVKDTHYQYDIECLSKDICGFCEGSLADDLNYSQFTKSSTNPNESDKEDRVVRNGASESPLIEVFDMKPVESQSTSMKYQQQDQQAHQHNFFQANDIITTGSSSFSSSNINHIHPKICREGPASSRSSFRNMNKKDINHSYNNNNSNNPPIRKYIVQSTMGNSTLKPTDESDSFLKSNSYLMREFCNIGEITDTNNTPRNQQFSSSQLTSISLFPSLNSLTAEEKSYRKIEYMNNGLPSSPNSHYRPPSIYEGVNDSKTLNRIYPTVPRSRSTNQLERYASSSASDSSASSPGISKYSSRYAKILSDAQTTTMLAQDLHKTLLSVKPI